MSAEILWRSPRFGMAGTGLALGVLAVVVRAGGLFDGNPYIVNMFRREFLSSFFVYPEMGRMTAIFRREWEMTRGSSTSTHPGVLTVFISHRHGRRWGLNVLQVRDIE
eukprot:963540-Amorphochlora_amoeboformis.AAC.1